MKNKLRLIITAVTLLSFPSINFGQIVLGSAASRFAIFTSSGAVSDNASAHSHVTGDVGTNGGGVITANSFGNVNGVMHNGSDGATAACVTALAATIAQINADTAGTMYPSATMGGGVTLDSGIYSIPANATLALNLILDAQNNPNAQFIIKIGGTFSASTNAKVLLRNGALACNVYWKIVGAMSIAGGVTLRGNFISNSAISLGSGDSLEGRILTTVGAIGIDGITAFTPSGCNSTTLSGPTFPNLATTACYTLFSSTGALSNTVGTTTVIGDVGKNTNGSAITGWDTTHVTGTLHSIRDSSTILCASDLSKLYDTLNAMVPDIELLYPTQFGHNLTLTPHVYLMNSGGANGPAALTDSLYLDAQGNINGVFVIKIIGGSLTTSTYAKVKLINGAQSKNVFWMVSAGAVSINNYSTFRGTIVVATGAINLLNTGVVLDGRALAMNGAITTQGLVAVMPPGCSLTSSISITSQPVNQTICAGNTASFSVTATGTGLTYQWRKGTVNLTNGGNISGTTSATLSINTVSVSDTASNYNVVIAGTPNITSNNVSLTVNVAPTISSAPTNQIACPNGSAVLSVTATGTGLTYQWRKGTVNLINTANISGATSATLTINTVSVSDTASNYNVVITGTCSPNYTSTNISLSINTSIVINTAPVNQTACVGNSANFSVTAMGGGLNYQWRKGNVNLTNGGNISGATSASLRINQVSTSDNASNYNVIISGTCSPNDTTNNVSLTANALPTITGTTPNSICGSGAVILGATASAGIINWYANLTGGLSLATGTIYTTPTISANTSLYVDATLSGCTTASRTAVIATIKTIPTIIGTTPGSNCGTGTVLLGATASAGIINWYANLTGGTSLATGTSYTTPSISTNNTLYVDATLVGCTTISRSAIIATINTIPTITGTTPGSVTTSGTVTLGATASAGIINWYANATGGSSLATGISYTTPVISANDTLYVDATLLSCTTISRTAVIATVLNKTGIASVYEANKTITVYPNPFKTFINIIVNDVSQINNCEWVLYNILGKEMMHKIITEQTTTLETNNLPSGVYFFKLSANNKTLQSGKLIAQ